MTRITTTKAIEALTEPGRYSAGEGLYLTISPSGSRTWMLRYQVHGRRHDAGLGRYPEVSLTDARRAAFEAHQKISAGLDPILERRKSKAPLIPIPTFRDVAALVTADVTRQTVSEKSVARAERLLGPKYCACWQAVPITEISTTDIASRLIAIAASKPETARQLLGLLSKVFDRARVILRDQHAASLRENPTSLRDLRALGYGRKAETNSHAALDWRLAPDFMAALRQRDGVAFRALEFTILTGVREAAAAGAKWSEFDLEAGIWTVPLDRLKDRLHRKQPFRVPLSSDCRAVLEHMKGLHQTWVFPGLTNSQPLAPQSILQALKLRVNRDRDGNPIWRDPDSGRPIVVHGFRATLKTFADDQGVRHEVSEFTLGHAVGGNVERRYRRTDLLEERRKFLQAWADHCRNDYSTNVVLLRA
jgi:integrase